MALDVQQHGPVNASVVAINPESLGSGVAVTPNLGRNGSASVRLNFQRHHGTGVASGRVVCQASLKHIDAPEALLVGIAHGIGDPACERSRDVRQVGEVGPRAVERHPATVFRRADKNRALFIRESLAGLQYFVEPSPGRRRR